MKAIRVHEFGEPEVMRLEEVPEPQVGPGQVLVKVHAVGVNPVETYIRSGALCHRAAPALHPRHRRRRGGGGGGCQASHRVAPGDRVYTS